MASCTLAAGVGQGLGVFAAAFIKGCLLLGQPSARRLVSVVYLFSYDIRATVVKRVGTCSEGRRQYRFGNPGGARNLLQCQRGDCPDPKYYAETQSIAANGECRIFAKYGVSRVLAVVQKMNAARSHHTNGVAVEYRIGHCDKQMMAAGLVGFGARMGLKVGTIAFECNFVQLVLHDCLLQLKGSSQLPLNQHQSVKGGVEEHPLIQLVDPDFDGGMTARSAANQRARETDDAGVEPGAEQGSQKDVRE